MDASTFKSLYYVAYLIMNLILHFSEQVGLSTLSPTPVSSSVLGRPISAMSQPVTSSHNGGGYYQNMHHAAAPAGSVVGSPNGMIPTPFTQTSVSSSALPNGNLPQQHHHQQQQQQQQHLQQHQQEQYYWNQYQT